MTGPKKVENRGGKRTGAGRKAIYTFSEKEKKSLLRAARKANKQHGRTVGAVLMDHIYQKEDQRHSLMAIKVYHEAIITPATEKDVTTKVITPTIGLPGLKPDLSMTGSVVPFKKAE